MREGRKPAWADWEDNQERLRNTLVSMTPYVLVLAVDRSTPCSAVSVESSSGIVTVSILQAYSMAR